MRNLRSGLVFLCVVVWTGVMLDLDGPLGSLTRLTQWPALIAWSLCVLYEGKLRKLHSFHWAMLCFIAWNVITSFWSEDVARTQYYCSRYIMAFLVSIMMWDTFRTRDDVGLAARAFVTGCYIIAGLTIINYVQGGGMVSTPFDNRSSAGDLHPDDLGLILAIGIPLAWRGALSETLSSTAVRVFNLVFPFVAVLAIILSGTRGGLVAAIPSFLYLPFSTRFISLKWRGFLAVVITVCLIGVFSLFAARGVPRQVERLMTTTSSLSASGDGLGGRVNIWRAGVIVFERSPLLGVGAGAFPEATRSFMDGVSPTGDPLVAHNTYLSIIVETGLIGFLVFLCMIGVIIKSLVRYQGQDKGAWIAALAAWFIGVFSLTFEFRPQTWLLFTLVLIGTQQFERTSERIAERIPPMQDKRLPNRRTSDAPLPSKVR